MTKLITAILLFVSTAAIAQDQQPAQPVSAWDPAKAAAILAQAKAEAERVHTRKPAESQYNPNLRPVSSPYCLINSTVKFRN